MATGPTKSLRGIEQKAVDPRRETDLTPAQQRAVDARGNVLVMAGAGTGKTHTLVERCLGLICDEQVSLDEILIVTFTETAAMEMRERLREALEAAAVGRADASFAEQLALFDAAHIGTLHSFCFKLVREHFHELGLDPQLSVLDEGQARLLADETIGEQFEAHYENEDAFSLAAQELIRIYGSGSDEKIRALVLRLHNYIQTRADAEAWVTRQIENFSSAAPLQWREWFSQAVSNWRSDWLPILQSLRAENAKAGECLELLEKFSGGKTSTASLFEKVLESDKPENYPSKKKTALRKPLEEFFEDAEFLGSLAAAGKTDPLAEDWEWVRGHMKTLLLLAKEFSEKFSARKRTDGAVDFRDLEQFAIRLLWDSRAGGPTEIARHWRAQLRFVFVDEYQDINAAQDRIISALSCDNRFLVGDVKQSIYRFRLANPQIFQEYAKDPRAWNGQTIALAENFRSREGLLDFINSLFAPLMREDIGGVLYDDEAKLKFGSPETRGELSLAKNFEPRVELLLRAKHRGENSGAETGGDALGDLQESEKEARLLALRLLELKNSGHQIWDDGKFRAADWSDFAVLLRAPGAKAEIFAKQFERAGVPLFVERGGFYDSSEISDLLSLLQLADNPLQDVPCIAVLRSPLAGCAMDELAEIRLAGPGHFWFALNQVSKSKVRGETQKKVEKFLERFSRWRRLAQQASLSQCLEAVLAETHYDAWLLSRPRGTRRRANVQRFLALAEQYDAFQRQGLYRFLRFIEAQREIDAEPEVAPLAEENAVRLMSIHQSKGLEFPVVALADLGKKFNEQDLHGEIILDERFGLCPRVKPPSSGGRYPSLAYWLAQKNQRRELRGEELRLLYVALTRARDTLILSGGVSEKKWENLFQNSAPIAPCEILSAGNGMDWLGLWFRIQNAKDKIENPLQGKLPALQWRFTDDSELAELPAAPDKPKPAQFHIDKTTEKELAGVLDWQYSHQTATRLPAKTSVTALRRQAAEEDDEAQQKFSARLVFSKAKRRGAGQQLSAEDTGVAHHKFLQHFSFDAATDLKSFAAEAKRLEKENYLSAEETAALDVEALADFWSSAIGKKIRAKTPAVKRELPFTASFPPGELDEILGTNSAADLSGEFVVVQGVADLVVLSPKEIWLVDFKTDGVSAKELPDKVKTYSPQLQLYARALEKIYLRPVTNCWLHFLAARKTVTVGA